MLHLAVLATTASVPAPKSHAEFSQLMASIAHQNQSLYSYFFPANRQLLSEDPRVTWSPSNQDCEIKRDCWCFHVTGDMSRSRNPDGSKHCAGYQEIHDCSSEADASKQCACLSGPSCLFSDMRPVKLIAAITAARAAGVTHIIEEGRFGGLSAFMYALHGFKVTSLEFLPLSGPTAALARAFPEMTLLTGDGSKVLPELLHREHHHGKHHGDAEQERVMGAPCPPQP